MRLLKRNMLIRFQQNFFNFFYQLWWALKVPLVLNTPKTFKCTIQIFFGQFLINLYLYLFVYMHVYECYFFLFFLFFSCIHLRRLMPLKDIDYNFSICGNNFFINGCYISTSTIIGYKTSLKKNKFERLKQTI